jgi:ketosteroid isomerase-like protein
MRRALFVVMVVMAGIGAANAQAPKAMTAAEREVRSVIAAYNADYARNDLDAYFGAFAPDLTQWFPPGRVDLPSYRASWSKYIGAGNTVQAAEVRDLRVQVGPSADSAVATYLLRVTTRSAKGEVSIEDNQETDVLFKRGGVWSIVHVNYAPARVQPGKPGQ